MKSYRTLAWKELRAQKITSILILIALVLSTMMTTAIGQSIGILNAMRGQQAAYLNGNRYATLHQLTPIQVDNLISDSRLAYAEKMISIGVAAMPNSNISVLLREYENNALSAYESISQLEKGGLPEKANEIALPQDVLSMIGFTGEIGDTVSLGINISLMPDTDIPHEFSQDFILTGVLKPNYIGYVSGSTSGIVGAGTAKQILPGKYFLYAVDIRTADKGTFQNTIDDLIEIHGVPDYCVQYNSTLLSALGIDYRAENRNNDTSGFSFIALSGVLIAALVLCAAGLVVYNILKIAVTKRVKEYGTLRAIGAERSKLYTLVSLQLAILCGIGIPTGIALGLLSVQGITTAATSFFSPSIFMANSQSEIATLIANNSGNKILPIIISAVISLIFAFLAAIPAARYAARVSPTLAMSGQTVNVKRRNRSPKHIRNFEAFYARMNMKRNRGRTAITILSLVMSITVFVALQSFSALLDASANVQKMHHGDYSITNNTAGFSPEAVGELKSLTGIRSMSTLKYKLYVPNENGNMEIVASFTLQPGETLHVAGIDEQQIRTIITDISEPDLQALKDGRACLIKNPIPISFGGTSATSTVITADETVTVNEKLLTVIDEINNPVTLDNEGFTNGIQIIVFDTIFDQITGQSNYIELYPTLAENVDREAVEQAIQTLCTQTGGRWLSYQNTDQQLRESYEQIRLLAWGLILFVGLIGILNIINTVFTNIHTRLKEIGVGRAIGMSIGSLYKTFLWEGAYYGIIAAVIGSIAGYVCTIFINAATTGAVQIVAVPIFPILQATVLSITACLMATYIPLTRIAKMNIVTSIASVE